MSVLTPSINRDRLSNHLHIRCFWSPAPALGVPCTLMYAVSSVGACLIDLVFHGICPNVMTFGVP